MYRKKPAKNQLVKCIAQPEKLTRDIFKTEFPKLNKTYTIKQVVKADMGIAIYLNEITSSVAFPIEWFENVGDKTLFG